MLFDFFLSRPYIIIIRLGDILFFWSLDLHLINAFSHCIVFNKFKDFKRMFINKINFFLRLSHEVLVIAHVLIIMVGPFPLPEQSKSAIISIRPNISDIAFTVPVMIPRRQANCHILEQNFASVKQFHAICIASFIIGIKDMLP